MARRSTTFAGFRKTEEKEKQARERDKLQIELRYIAEKAQVQRTLEEETQRIEKETFRKKRNVHVTDRIANAFGTKKDIVIEQNEINNKLNKAFIPTKTFPEPFEEEPALNRELAEFKKKIHEHIAQLGLAHSSGGGAGSIADLDDIQISTAKVDGKALVYDSSSGKWIGESVLSGAITGLDIDGGTDIGADLADADLIIVDDGAGGTNRKAALSRLKTYIGAGAADDLSAGDAAVTLTTTSGDITIDAAANNSDIILKGTDGGVDTTFLTIDGSAAGAATFNDKIVATELDISGDVDIDGTLEADAITVDGTTLAEFIADTTGAMVSSNTETGITVTYQDGDNTLDFALATAQTTITSLLATDIKIGEDDQTKIDFETADEIHFYAANAHQIKLVDGALVPATDNDIDLGTSSVEFKDAFFDGTVTSDAFAGPLTGDVTGNADTATALATARTIGGVSFDGSANIDLLATDIKIGEDDQTKIDFETADEIHFYAANAEQVFVSDGVFGPQTDSDVDLGTTGVRWKDAYIDTITTTGNVTVGGDFTVSGTTTTVNKVTVNVEDAFVFEGATADAYETTFSVTDPTADRVILLPDTNGEVQVTPPMTLNGTDGSSSNAGDYLVQDTSADENDRLMYEDATSDVLAVFASHGITLAGVGWNAFQLNNDA